MEKEAAAKGGIPKIDRVGIISPVGKLLSLTAGEAERYGLAAGLAASRESLFSALGVTGEITESAPSVWDDVISLLTSGPVQAILILLGLVMIFLEIQSPGFGIPGVTAIIAFIVVFGSSALLGRVGSLEIILFMIGIGLLAVEIFVTPGFGVMGISGILLIGISLVFSMQDFVIPRFDWEWALFGRNALVVFVGLLAAISGIAVIALVGPKIKIFDRLMLKTQITGTAGGPDPESPAAKALSIMTEAATDKSVLDKSAVTLSSGFALEDEENLAALVGKIGTTDSILRPSGRAMIDGKIYTVEADGEYVDSGRGIVVTRVRGNRIIVRRV
jgi:membrane-bound serine protease (ClpP class)